MTTGHDATGRTGAVGLAGLGNLGAPVARRIAATGWDLTVFDRVPERAGDVPGAAAATSLDDVLDRDVLVLVVPDDRAVESLLLGPDGYLARAAGAARPRTVVVHSTILPATAQQLARHAAEAGVGFLDAPVSGGSERAENGSLTVFLGAEPDHVEPVRTLLGDVAASVEHVGAPGAGAAVKLANQLMLFAALGGVHEGLALAARFGVEEADLLRCVGTSTGASWSTDNWGFFDETARSYNRNGTPVRDRPWGKDLLEVLEAARSVDLAMPVAATASQTVARYVEDHARLGER
ncbi:NAD(P)-dependent oxidoreductase [Georgenia alba]|uniref:NAD(P)-dependent oxidoreductase n=1 Tax=Georgenia alba TaxID=2233858 RepID=A0ABW2Q3X9_9MICO